MARVKEANEAESRKGNRRKSGKYLGIRYKIVISLRGFKSVIYTEDGVVTLNDPGRDKILNYTKNFIEQIQ